MPKALAPGQREKTGKRSLARAKPVTEAERARLRELHEAGLNCRQIAREMGRTPATVSKHAAELGLSFDRAQVRAATAARVADTAARRAEISAEFLAITQKINARVLELLNDPDAEVKPWGLRDYAMASGMYFEKHLSQDQHDRTGEEGGAVVDQWLVAVTGHGRLPVRG